MNGFCSAPTPDKRREKHLVFLLTILGILLFVISGLPGMFGDSVLWIWQFFAVASLAFAVYVLALCLLRHYVYAIEPRENAPAEAPLDFTVTQICGKRRTVVARFSVEDLREIRPVTPGNRRTIAQEMRGKRCFDYSGVLFAESTAYVEAEVSGETVFVKIFAEERFLGALYALNNKKCP